MCRESGEYLVLHVNEKKIKKEPSQTSRGEPGRVPEEVALHRDLLSILVLELDGALEEAANGWHFRVGEHLLGGLAGVVLGESLPVVSFQDECIRVLPGRVGEPRQVHHPEVFSDFQLQECVARGLVVNDRSLKALDGRPVDRAVEQAWLWHVNHHVVEWHVVVVC